MLHHPRSGVGIEELPEGAHLIICRFFQLAPVVGAFRGLPITSGVLKFRASARFADSPARRCLREASCLTLLRPETAAKDTASQLVAGCDHEGALGKLYRGGQLPTSGIAAALLAGDRWAAMGRFRACSSAEHMEFCEAVAVWWRAEQRFERIRRAIASWKLPVAAPLFGHILASSSSAPGVKEQQLLGQVVSFIDQCAQGSPASALQCVGTLITSGLHLVLFKGLRHDAIHGDADLESDLLEAMHGLCSVSVQRMLKDDPGVFVDVSAFVHEFGDAAWLRRLASVEVAESVSIAESEAIRAQALQDLVSLGQHTSSPARRRVPKVAVGEEGLRTHSCLLLLYMHAVLLRAPSPQAPAASPSLAVLAAASALGAISGCGHSGAQSFVSRFCEAREALVSGFGLLHRCDEAFQTWLRCPGYHAGCMQPLPLLPSAP